MLDAVGGMDENFELYFEDADLCVRCWNAGFEVLFVPQMKVFHGLGQSGKAMRKKIELNPEHPEYITTEPWVGYRFKGSFDPE